MSESRGRGARTKTDESKLRSGVLGTDKARNGIVTMKLFSAYFGCVSLLFMSIALTVSDRRFGRVESATTEFPSGTRNEQTSYTYATLWYDRPRVPLNY